MYTNPYALEMIAKSQIQDRIDQASRDRMARESRPGKSDQRSPQAGTLLGLTALVLAAVSVASAL